MCVESLKADWSNFGKNPPQMNSACSEPVPKQHAKQHANVQMLKAIKVIGVTDDVKPAQIGSVLIKKTKGGCMSAVSEEMGIQPFNCNNALPH